MIASRTGEDSGPSSRSAPWEGTKDALHLWTQVVGKVRLALAPMVNHWWQVPLYVSARGLTTSLMPDGHRGLEMEFDFIEHTSTSRSTDGQRRRVPLQACSVADFYSATMSALAEIGVFVDILARPVELPDRDAVPPGHRRAALRPRRRHRFWLALVQVSRVMGRLPRPLSGQGQPRALLLGRRRPGRLALLGPPRARSIPAASPTARTGCRSSPTATKSAAAASGPAGRRKARSTPTPTRSPRGSPPGGCEPSEAYFDEQLGEFLLPYRVVRRAGDPDAVLLRLLPEHVRSGRRARGRGTERRSRSAAPAVPPDDGSRAVSGALCSLVHP